MDNKSKGISLAILAAALYAVSTPFSKILLKNIQPTMLAGLLYLGAGLGMVLVLITRRITKHEAKESNLSKKELPFVIMMILLDVAAPVLFMFGLKITTSANAALLNNFEIVATALIALFIFKEAISKSLWFGILLITSSCVLLSFENVSAFQFSKGSILILLAAICWGLENNCTRKISSKDPIQIVLLKGIFSGSFSIILALLIGERPILSPSVFLALLIGMFSFGISIFAYVYAQ